MGAPDIVPEQLRRLGCPKLKAGKPFRGGNSRWVDAPVEGIASGLAWLNG
jgi:hypothetical protein